ncbi:retron St85 family RNA-directed DNA polymerase [Sulfitobacter faviae]|uniref:RNA-directed DNA polymerase n=1 Tax=Sulfitobacter faviae TaxID=1775881 RepID=A0AAX3LLY8_9RHOB|nr:retron St85 family RNA-directed DNA polymerase [Sulfitobacter faviae]WCE69636.1 retron St85 family RNA-directed DNA polymerase [Sulfitobacter faviae]
MGNLTLLREIALDTGLSEESVSEIIQDAPRRYKVYPIPKKGGGRRLIAQPARELKPIQRAIVDLVLEQFPVHSTALAYRKGLSIADNARIHSGTWPILKLDFESFFNSISAAAWRRFVSNQEVVSIDRADLALITKALFWGAGQRAPYCLSIGAPSSPLVSNIIMFEFDSNMYHFAKKHGIRYTRYADDITVSAKKVGDLYRFEKHLRAYISRNKTPALTVNEAKRAVYSASQRRLVTGLVLTSDGKVSLGRDRKREISALIHRHSLGQLDEEQLSYLHGMLAFALSSERAFVGRMREKYGGEAITSVLKYRVPRRDGSAR